MSGNLVKPAIDPATVTMRTGSSYPEPFKAVSENGKSGRWAMPSD